MDFMSSFAKGAQPKPASDDQPNNPDHPDKPSNPDLFSSAKVVADAAQAQFRSEPEKYDKAKLAGATADLLNSASEYGKLDETHGIGKYVDRAEGYLRQYNTSQSTPTDALVADPTKPKTTKTEGPDLVYTPAPGGDSDGLKSTANDAPTADCDSDKLKTTATYALASVDDFGGDKTANPASTTTVTESTDAEIASRGAEDYVKKAESFLNKPSGDGEGGGAGDCLKAAEDLLKKPSDGTEGGGVGDYVKVAKGFPNKPSGGGGEKAENSSEAEGGYGNMMKMAGGFLKK